MTRAGASLARLGLTEPWAEATLTELGWWAGDRPVEGAENVMWALARSPDPDLALRAVERLVAAVADRREFDAAIRAEVELRGRLLALLGSSTILADHLAVNPDRWHRLRDGSRGPQDDPTPTLLAAVGADPDAPHAGGPGGGAARLTGPAALQALRTAYRDELVVLAAADLAAVSEPELPILDVEDVAARLSDLAAAALRAALAIAVAEADGDPGRLAVIAMGKCGGRELNYVSDVDVVFVAEPADADAARLAARVMRILGESCFEVDANLRPEGRQGALVRTLDGHVSYYKRWAKTWEFQALLKARPVAGDPELGKAYAEAVAPMVWNAAGRPDFVGDVQAMRRRVEENVRPDQRAREIKLGPGGLRDVEFAVQLLQLVHGRTDEALRSGSTLDALTALVGRRLRRARRRGEPRRVLPVPAAAGAPAAAATAAPHPPAAARQRHGRAAVAGPFGQAAARRAARRRRRPHGRVDAQRPPRAPPAREAVLPAAAHRGVAVVPRHGQALGT